VPAAAASARLVAVAVSAAESPDPDLGGPHPMTFASVACHVFVAFDHLTIRFLSASRSLE
jgi:hypothetical protein